MSQPLVGEGAVAFDRRDFLRITVLAGGAFALAACAGEGSAPNTSTTTPADVLPTGDALPGATETTPARQVPQVAGEALDLPWKTVRNRRLADDIRREGEDFPGDASVSDHEDPTFWPQAAVVGVERDEVDSPSNYEAELSIASVTADANHEEADVVRYADLSSNRDNLLRTTAQGKKVLALRTRIGHTACTIGFISGEVNDDQSPNPSWAAESTKVAARTTVSDPKWGEAPLV